jgi:hypothetical protein
MHRPHQTKVGFAYGTNYLIRHAAGDHHRCVEAMPARWITPGQVYFAAGKTVYDVNAADGSLVWSKAAAWRC